MIIDGVPELAWTVGESAAVVDGDALVLTAPAGVDWSNDSLGGPQQHRAGLLGWTAPQGDFVLSARVRVVGPRTPFDAGVLALWADRDHWAKLCFEQGPQAAAMVCSVVTDGFSDDCNSEIVTADHVHLRIARVGPAFAFHASPDGETWTFVRLFRLRTDRLLTVGFLAQAPMGERCEVRFDRISWTRRTLPDLRSGA